MGGKEWTSFGTRRRLAVLIRGLGRLSSQKRRGSAALHIDRGCD
jgi:hypothetical protein